MILIFYVVDDFIVLENKDCLLGNHIHFLQSNQQSNYENCRQWCKDNRICAGFTVAFDNICFFKTAGCKDDIFASEGVVTFLYQGNEKN